MDRFLKCLGQILGRWVGFLDVVYFFSPLLSLHSKMEIQQGEEGPAQLVLFGPRIR